MRKGAPLLPLILIPRIQTSAKSADKKFRKSSYSRLSSTE
jgi:hypothetical protein